MRRYGQNAMINKKWYVDIFKVYDYFSVPFLRRALDSTDNVDLFTECVYVPITYWLPGKYTSILKLPKAQH